jgi:hypothetical protein
MALQSPSLCRVGVCRTRSGSSHLAAVEQSGEELMRRILRERASRFSQSLALGQNDAVSAAAVAFRRVDVSVSCRRAAIRRRRQPLTTLDDPRTRHPCTK